MKIEDDANRLIITELNELCAANAIQFREEVYAALSNRLSLIEIDLSETRHVDSSGLGALCSLQRSAGSIGISLRLLNPEPSVQQLFELTQMHQIFDIVHKESTWPGPPLPAPRPSSPSTIPAVVPLV